MQTAVSADIKNITVGDTASCELVIAEADVDTFAALSHDTNPLHMDTAFARQYGFSGRVAHGMLALAVVSRLIGTKLPGPGSLWIGHDVQFVAPVCVGDRLEVRVTVKNISWGAQVVVLSTDVLHIGTGKVALRGVAKVRIPQRVLDAAE